MQGRGVLLGKGEENQRENVRRMKGFYGILSIVARHNHPTRLSASRDA